MTETLTVSCPNCGTEHRGIVHPPAEATDVVLTNSNPDGILRVTCARCGEEYEVGYRAVIERP